MTDTEGAVVSPPDGGWGWIVVFGSFMVHVVADGVAYSFGVFLNSFIDYYDEGRGVTGWLGSLMIGVTWLSGPVAGLLIDQFGCRVVCILGSVVSCLGFVISIFSPNIWFMYFSFGILSGFGLGLIYLPSIVCVAFYFEEKRAFATGLAVCGSGLGMFIFAPLSQVLLDNYGWKGAVLIEGGFLLNCAVFGALFRPLEAPKGSYSNSNALENGTVELKEANSDTVALGNDTVEYSTRQHAHENHQNSLYPNHEIELEPLKKSQEVLDRDKTVPETVVANCDNEDENTRCTSFLNSFPAETHENHSASPQAEEDKAKSHKCSSFDANQIFNKKLFLDPVFLLYFTSFLFSGLGFCVPYIFLPDRAKQFSISDSKASFLISIIGITNTVGRLLFGWIADRKGVNRLMLFAAITGVTGVCSILSVAATIYPLLALYAATFGLLIGGRVSLLSVVTTDLLGIEIFTHAFGWISFIGGVSGIIGPPIAGWAFDATGTYDASFFMMGSMTIFSGLLLASVPCIRRYKLRRK